MAELKNKGIRFTPDNVLAAGRTIDGHIVFLELGNSRARLQHIIAAHSENFADIGIPAGRNPDVIMQAVTEGRVAGYQGSGAGRPVYETVIKGQPQRIAITTDSNGFIVGASPAGGVK